jgi:hypothetical protein
MTVALMNEISNNLKHLKGTDGTVPIGAGITASGVIEATGGMGSNGRVSGFVFAEPISGDSHITVSGMATAQAGLVSLSHMSGKGNLTVSGLITAQAGVTSISHISALGNLTVSGIVNARQGFTTPTHVSTAGNVSVEGTVDGVDMAVHGTASGSGVHGLLCITPSRLTAVNCGSYVGNGKSTETQAIAHFMGKKPFLVKLQSTGSGYHVAHINQYGVLCAMCASAASWAGGGVITSSFIVGDETGVWGQVMTMNQSGITYYWCAIG